MHLLSPCNPPKLFLKKLTFLLCRISMLTVFFNVSLLKAQVKGYLYEGERLCVGEYLLSENERFRMGFNELGELEIIDLKPNTAPALNLLRRHGWDGKTFWKAREGKPFTPQQNSILYPGPPSPYGDMMHKSKDEKYNRETVPMQNFGIWDTSYLTLEPIGKLVVYTKSLITQFDPPVPRVRWEQNLGFNGSGLVEQVRLCKWKSFPRYGPDGANDEWGRGNR